MPLKDQKGGMCGVQLNRTFTGLSQEDQKVFAHIAKEKLRNTAKDSTWFDTQPPDVFAYVLNSCSGLGAVKFGTDAHAFFGLGGVHAPSGMIQFNRSTDERHGGLLLEADLVDVAPGQSATLCVLVGYLPPRDGNYSVAQLVHKYAEACAGHAGAVGNVAGQWRGHLAQLNVANAPAIGPELAWHSFYLQSGASYDDYFKEHIVDQVRNGDIWTERERERERARGG